MAYRATIKSKILKLRGQNTQENLKIFKSLINWTSLK